MSLAATNKTSGLLTADAVLHSGVKSILAGVQVITDGTNDATLVITDDSSGVAGTKLFKAVVTGTDDSRHFTLPDGGVRADNGLSCDVTGTGAAFIVWFR
jgi:hypothetical protein